MVFQYFDWTMIHELLYLNALPIHVLNLRGHPRRFTKDTRESRGTRDNLAKN